MPTWKVDSSTILSSGHPSQLHPEHLCHWPSAVGEALPAEPETPYIEPHEKSCTVDCDIDSLLQ